MLIPVLLIVGVIAFGNREGDPSASGLVGSNAPEFTLPATDGVPVSLDDVLAEGSALLYFSMGVGCDGCFAQIPEVNEGLAELGITLVPVMVQPPDQVAATAARFDIDSPILIDQDRAVSSAYGMLGVYGHTDRPSHSFALVTRDRKVDWVKHYATMFVPADDLLTDLQAAG